jgi:DNA sulfur modification protein DndB
MVANMMDLAAIRGRMGAREFFCVMFPLGLVPRYFKFRDWGEMPPEQRAQRKLSDKRVPEIARYILDHEDDWVFSSLTASFDVEPEFIETEIDPNIGILRMPLEANFLINDGQHRKAAIEQALKQNKTLEKQSISVVMFPEEDLETNQQIFSDLNRTVHKTSRSLDILYDHRDPMNRITIDVADAVPIFQGRVEKDRVSVAVRSKKFVALSALYDANVALLGKFKEEDAGKEAEEALEDRAIAFWSAVTENIPEWKDVLEGEMKPAEVRAEFINAHAVAFWALGAAGKALVEKYPDEAGWKARLEHLAEIDWRKTNPEWQGICMLGSDIITRRQTREATSKYIQWKLGVLDRKPERVLDTEPVSA